MQLTSILRLLAGYNQSINTRFYECASKLSAEELTRDCGIFFQSVIGTFNHIMVGDLIWLQRFATHPASFESLRYVRGLQTPPALDALIYPEFGELRKARVKLDSVICEFVDELGEDILSSSFSYNDTEGKSYKRNMGYLLLHFFNHQTHHRGQISALLGQAGLDVGVTDLVAEIPNA